MNFIGSMPRVWLRWGRKDLFDRNRCAAPKKPGRRPKKTLGKRLGLSPEQQVHLDRLTDELDAFARLWQDAAKLRSNLRELLAEPKLDRPKAMAMIRHETRAADERAAELVMAFAEFSDSLDEAQRYALTAWLEDGCRRGRKRSKLWRWRHQ